MPLEKREIDFICNSVRFVGNHTDHGGTWSDLQIMTLAKARTMDKGGRAEHYLNHYLEGSGEPIYFSLRTLMDEDPGVRARIISTINALRRAGEGDGRNAAILSSVPKAGQIPIPQTVFQNHDWQFATGSLNVNWRFIEEINRNGTKMMKVELWTTNIYRWHPTEGRRTQCVHQAAVNLQHPQQESYFPMDDRIHGSGMVPGMVWPDFSKKKTTNYKAAKDFPMIAKPEAVLIPKTAPYR
ncbi:hypothetical protein [Rhizobium paknamense]|uniref:Uncharacterized protein n=1 Tax=Rhizobium paknamense TaxID=1206817 RepID=A0ABU0IGJ5_9HYPH|nr:hypothetical protein [Rhizobium paknamense]MDQ0457390.1 hypothetical protein [Rhizobium paknamense]